MRERLAALGTLIALIAVPIGVVAFEYWHHSEGLGPKVKVVDLTGVASTGTWTLEPVSGLNYWWKQFEPATIHLSLGEEVLLRFHSADVFHQFYVPALSIGPISVKPGSVKELLVRPEEAGAFEYYCTYMCGGCHFYMRGWIIVTPPGQVPEEPPPLSCPVCLPDFGDPPEDDAVALGEYLYRKMGCGTCHGMEGRGGIGNFNYINEAIPPHDNTASKFFLRSEEDAAEFLDLVTRTSDLEGLEEPPDIAGFPIVRARYEAAMELIRLGKNAARLDLEGPEPPLQMPAWKYKMSEREMAAVIAYFVSLYPWEEDE